MIAPYVQFNTGENDTYIASDDPVIGIRGIMDKKLNENMLWTLNVGYAYQSEEEIAQVNINHSLLFGAGLVLSIPETRYYLTAEIYGRSEDLSDSESTPIEGLVSYGYDFGNATFTLGAAVGLTNGYGASEWRVFSGLRFRM